MESLMSYTVSKKLVRMSHFATSVINTIKHYRSLIMAVNHKAKAEHHKKKMMEHKGKMMEHKAMAKGGSKKEYGSDAKKPLEKLSSRGVSKKW
jgi:hypothetical protein